jgi:hypothetical protein
MAMVFLQSSLWSWMVVSQGGSPTALAKGPRGKLVQIIAVFVAMVGLWWKRVFVFFTGCAETGGKSAAKAAALRVCSKDQGIAQACTAWPARGAWSLNRNKGLVLHDFDL